MKIDYNDDNISSGHRNRDPSNLDLEDRMNLVAGRMINRMDKGRIELLYGYYPDSKKEMAVCLALCNVVWDLF